MTDSIESRTKCPSPDEMSDLALVNYVSKRFTKFLIEMRPYLIEVHTRWYVKRAKFRPFLGYTDWDKFCQDYFNYSGRHVRRVITGESIQKPKRLPAAAISSTGSSTTLKQTAIWTDHDFIHKGAQYIKQILQPLESDPARYAKVAAAIAEEITGDASAPKSAAAGA